MRAIDANIILRLILRDDDHQCAIADELAQQPFLLLPTVFLEVGWFLDSRAGLSRARVAAELRDVLGHQNCFSASGDLLGWALDRYEAGADFADMIHVAFASASEATSFATFDRRVGKWVDPADFKVEELR